MADVIVSAPYEDIGANTKQGRVYVFSGATFEVLYALTTPNPQTFTELGDNLAVGDINADGKGDIVVSAQTEYSGQCYCNGNVYAFSGATGSLLRTFTSQGNPELQFGSSIAVADLNHDARTDVIVGSSMLYDGSLDARTGLVHAFSGANGALLYTLETPNPDLHFDGSFGFPVLARDVNGDGNADIIAGASGEDSGTGATYIFSSPTTLFKALRPDLTTTTGTQGELGFSVAIGDVDGNGTIDVIVGAPAESHTVGNLQPNGSVYVFRDGSLPPPVGGIVEEPHLTSLSATTTVSGDRSRAHAFGGAALVLVVAIGAGVWYATKVRSA